MPVGQDRINEQLRQMSERNNLIKKLVIFGGGALGLLILLSIFWPFTSVPTGARGVVTHFGKVQGEVLDEGLHLTAPIMTTVRIVSVQLQKNEIQTTSSSKDLQQVDTHVVVNWMLDSTKVNEIYQTIGDTTAVLNNVITPAVSEVFKAASAKRTAEEIIGKRIELTHDVDEMLKTRLSKYGIIMRDISLVNVNFTKEFNRAVEAKQVAEQEAKQAEYTALKAEADAKAEVNKAKGEAEATLTRARAQAESQKLMQKTITSEILQQQAIEKWDGSFPQVIGGNGALPFINLKVKEAKKQGADNE